MEEALALFVGLSSALAGDEHPPDDLHALYFARAQTALADELPALLARFADPSKDGIDPVTALRLHSAASADGYYRAMVWDVIGAHPPTLAR